MPKVLNVENLYKKYNDQLVLNNVSFEIKDGDIVGLIGENGAGKSTIISILAGVNCADSGKVKLVENITVSERIEYYEKLCVAFDQSPFYPQLSGINNLRLFSDNENEIVCFLKLCGLENVKNKKVSTYSLGMKQRLNIARAFLMWSKLMIMDEPINGLDPGIVIDIKKYIREQCQSGRSVLISSHALKEMLYFCNKFIFIHKGSIIAEIDASNKNFEKFDNYADTTNPELMKWLKENNIDYLVIPELYKVYFTMDSDIPEEFVIYKIEDGTNILEIIYLHMRTL